MRALMTLTLTAVLALSTVVSTFGQTPDVEVCDEPLAVLLGSSLLDPPTFDNPEHQFTIDVSENVDIGDVQLYMNLSLGAQLGAGITNQSRRRSSDTIATIRTNQPPTRSPHPVSSGFSFFCISLTPS